MLRKLIINSKLNSCCSKRNIAMKSLCMDNLNPAVKKVEYAVRGPIPIRANEIQGEINSGKGSYPFEKIIKANIGDCHATGGKYISFVRQVLSVCTCPTLQSSSAFPSDVMERSKKILKNCGPGQSLGSYSESSGIDCLRKDVADYITKRDGMSCDFENVFASCGASDGIRTILKLLIAGTDAKLQSGVMIPIPQYPLYSAALSEYNIHQVGYYLDESNKWAISIDELTRAYDNCKTCCTPRAIVVINPGNPTGQLLDPENIQKVIKFAKDRNLIILADEVYQDNIYDDDQKFVSFRKTVMSMPAPYNQSELASFHSASKGFMGECGARGGYFEVLNFDPEVIVQLKKLISTNLCPPVWGQVVMDLVINPPAKEDPSYELFMKEKLNNLKDLKVKANLVSRLLNEIDGVSCNPIKGAMYAFPKIELPNKFVKFCEKEGKAPDAVYCMRLLESTGICVVPGSGFGQKEGTHHFRMTILPSLEEIKVLLSKFKEFHLNIVKEYST